MEAEAEDFEHVAEDEELALAVHVAEEEEEKERQKVTVAVLPSRHAGEANSSRPLNLEPLRVALAKKKKVKDAPKKKQAAVDAGQPVGIPEGYSYLNTAALDVKTKATAAEYQATQFFAGPSARVVEPGPDDVQLHAPGGCFAAHILSVELGIRFPLHPFVLEYLRFLKLAPCQLTPNSHTYLPGFLSLYRSRGVEPSLDQFFLSFSLCGGGGGGGGHSNAGGVANLQQVPEFRLFDDVPSSHKGWKDKFCYIRMAENPFPAPLCDHFRRYPKVGNAALEKNGKKLAKKPEGSDKHVTIKEATLPDDLFDLSFRRYRLVGEVDEKYPLIDCVFESTRGASMDVRNFVGLKKKLAKELKKKETGTQNPVDEFFQRDEGPSSAVAAAIGGAEAGGDQVAAAKRKAAGKAVVPRGKKLKKGGAEKKATPVVAVDEHSSSEPRLRRRRPPPSPLRLRWASLGRMCNSPS
ncbi:unnamed protein product [Cuscuta europaea]|uniref:Transposase (putative) gypsy type domain-containing protein n=1 Tax=Cuscuta europaea TaxID=41803 RepID=A0A9P0ZTN2_CUSEU|nr:unnamed protein product [Cuscuta europaea]